MGNWLMGDEIDLTLDIQDCREMAELNGISEVKADECEDAEHCCPGCPYVG